MSMLVQSHNIYPSGRILLLFSGSMQKDHMRAGIESESSAIG